MKGKIAAILIPAIFSLSYPAAVFAQQPAPQEPPWNWPGPWHMWSGGWGFWWIFPLFMLFMIVACAAMLLFGHRWGGAGRPPGRDRSWGDATHSALQILSERFARGEIQKQEYEEKIGVIRAGGQR